MPLGHHRRRLAICLTHDRDHLLFRKTHLAHRSLRNREPVSQLIDGPKIREQVKFPCHYRGIVYCLLPVLLLGPVGACALIVRQPAAA
jgi:hypothetical protein